MMALPGKTAPGIRQEAVGARIVADLPLIACGVLICAAGLAMAHAHGLAFRLSWIFDNMALQAIMAALVLCVDAGSTLILQRPADRLAHLRQRYTNPAFLTRLLASLPLFCALVVFMPVFSQIKSMIPLLHAYNWDEAFIEADRAIFFGEDAWVVLQPLLGYPIVTSALAMLYHLWILLVYLGSFFVLLYKEADSVRRCYFLSFFLTWSVIGSVLAVALASVGPCFLEPILGNSHFAAQMAYLHEANTHFPVPVLEVQRLLLHWYESGNYGFGGGISAMPSVHVAMGFLFYLAIRRISRFAGRVFFAYFIVIWVASVHLAYHYAVDGLLSVIVTAIIWKVSQTLLARWDRFSAAWQAGRSPSEALA